VVTATLETIADSVKRAGVKSPAMIIVGEVVGLADRLGWLGSKPLFGRRVLLPTLGGGNAVTDLAAPLRSAGAEVWVWPVGSAVDAELGEAVRTIERYDAVLLAGPDAVPRFLAQLLAAGLDARTLYRLRVGADDAPTAAALRAAGLRPDFVGVADETALAGINRLLVAGEAGAAGLIATELREIGIRADAAATHAIHPRTELAPLLREALAAGDISDLLLPDPALLPVLLDLLQDPDLLAGVRMAETPDAVLTAAQPALI
ncbi:MAG: uroporphyrin-III C-methyltransferase, partial [Firmicutes bacterium]|nr:uroporphyrin-III C-methyltransferase [Bacillota bacterium]